MRIINELLGKRNSSDVFDSFNHFSLTEKEMSKVRGGDDPPREDPIKPWPLP